MPAILEVALGLMFIYLSLALIVTAANQALKNALNMKAKVLEQALVRMIDRDLMPRFKEHPMISSLSQDGVKGPEWIPTEFFVDALLDTLPGKTRPTDLSALRSAVNTLPAGSELQKALSALVDDSVEDFTVARANISRWFDQMMKTTSTWYRYRLQRFTLAAAMIVSIVLNADTLAIADATWQDAELRGNLVAAAEAAADQDELDESPDGRRALSDLRLAGLPLSWTKEDLCSLAGQCSEAKDADGTSATAPSVSQLAANVLSKLLGLLATGLAVSLGAPFWFDLLKKVAQLRKS